MSLQKLLFYAQSWSLADGQRLFDEDIQAWRDGPVVKEVWTNYSGSNAITEDDLSYDLSGEQIDTIRAVWDSFKHLGRWELRDRTHRPDGAWKNTRGDLPDSTTANRKIPLREMAGEAIKELDAEKQWLLDNWERAKKAAH